jgi:hypothetical protein
VCQLEEYVKVVSVNKQSQCERVWTPSYRTNGCLGRLIFAHLRSCSSSKVFLLPVALEFSGPIEILEDIIADKMVYPSSQNENT